MEDMNDAQLARLVVKTGKRKLITSNPFVRESDEVSLWLLSRRLSFSYQVQDSDRHELILPKGKKRKGNVIIYRVR